MTPEHKVARAALGLPELTKIVYGPQDLDLAERQRRYMRLLSLAADASSVAQAKAIYAVSRARGIDESELGRLIMNLVDDYEEEG